MTSAPTSQAQPAQQVPPSTSAAPSASAAPQSTERSGLYSGIVGAVGGIASGLVVAGLNFIITRRKMAAEISNLEAQEEKIRLETEKIRLETEKLRKEFERAADAIPNTIAHALATGSEMVVYASTDRDLGHDFKVRLNSEWKRENDKYVPAGNKGEGSAIFDIPGAISIQRTNTDGRLELTLESYQYTDVVISQIPRDNFLEGTRKFRVSFDAKVSGPEHTLRLVFKDEEADAWLASTEQRISSPTWNTYSLYFQIPPSRSCKFRIDDIQVQSAPSTVQLRNFLLAEKRPPASISDAQSVVAGDAPSIGGAPLN